MTTVCGDAPAKLNLALHVTGRRDDGYHLLDSLVCFADVCDRLTVRAAAETDLTIDGPFSQGVPTGPKNLILKARALFDGLPPAAIHLEKNLPHAAGIGGGSSDAAAILRLSALLYMVPMPSPDAVLGLGADVPVCLRGTPTRMTGIGDLMDDVPPMPPLWALLVNPGVAVPTGPVFKGLETVRNPGLDAPSWSDSASFLSWVARQRNDLEAPARRLAPAIDAVLLRLNEVEGCRLARMSGSGATCFGLFPEGDAALAKRAEKAIAAEHPEWWVAAAPIAAGPPQVRRATT